MGSPAHSVMDSTPSNLRRSSSRASRKATREPESSLYNLSRSAYSLPPTPIASSFEDALPSAKRQRRQRSVNYDETTPRSKLHSRASDQKALAGSTEFSSIASKRSNRDRKSELLNGEFASATASDGERGGTPLSSSSNTKLRAPSEQSQPTLHSFLSKRPKDSEASQTSQAESVDLNNSAPDMAITASAKRRTRKSTPATVNGAGVLPKAEDKSQPSTRSSTPQSSRKDHGPKSMLEANAKGVRTSRPTTPVNSASAPKSAKNKVIERTKLATPVAQSDRSTPDNRFSTRSRRRNRQSAAPTTSEPPSVEKGSSRQASVSGRGADVHTPKSANKPHKSNTITLTLSRKALESVLSTTPMSQTPYSSDVGDSVIPTPVHVYDDNFHFDYDADMYRNNFGLDGQMDTPASPTSFSTVTSANRTSGRTRKPTIRALESLDYEKKLKRSRTRTPKPSSGEASQLTNGNDPKNAKETDTTSSKQPAAQESQASQNHEPYSPAQLLFELVSSALSPDFEESAGADALVEELRKEFEDKRESPKTHEPTAEKKTQSAGERMNEFGEECLQLPPDCTLVRSNNTYGDKDLPQPPIRIKSYAQINLDGIFGFPPLIGERNLPREIDGPFVKENVQEEVAKIRARNEAKKRGIVFDRSMSLAQLHSLIGQHDSTDTPQALDGPLDGVRDSKEAHPTRTRKRRRTESALQSQNSTRTEDGPERPDRRKRRRKSAKTTNTPPAPTPAPAPITAPAPRQKSKHTATPKRKPPAKGAPATGAASESRAAPTPVPTSDPGPQRLRQQQENKIVLRLLGPKNPHEKNPYSDTCTEESSTEESLAEAPPRSSKKGVSKKRSYSEINTDDDDRHGHRNPRKSPKLSQPKMVSPKIKIRNPYLQQKNAKRPEAKTNGVAPATPRTQNAHAPDPRNTGEMQPAETPSGRPRRPAAAAMIAGSRNEAEKRAQRSKARSRKSAPGGSSVISGFKFNEGSATRPSQIES